MEYSLDQIIRASLTCNFDIINDIDFDYIDECSLYEITAAAAEGGHIEMVRYLHSLNLPFGCDAFTYACRTDKNKNIEVISYILHNIYNDEYILTNYNEDEEDDLLPDDEILSKYKLFYRNFFIRGIEEAVNFKSSYILRYLNSVLPQLTNNYIKSSFIRRCIVQSNDLVLSNEVRSYKHNLSMINDES